MQEFKNFIAGKKITVMGLGLLGRGLKDTQFLVECGANVTVTDLKTADQLSASIDQLKHLPIIFKLGEHDPRDFQQADLILRNADVPKSSPFLKIATDNGIPVEMDESLFAKFFKGKIVGITGTRGKTTTTVLVHKILSSQYANVFLSGNILGSATLPLLNCIQETDLVVLELSSWQLQGFHDAQISPNASIFTNIYPDHLNRYEGMSDYIQDKKAIYMYQKQGDFCCFNADQEKTKKLSYEARAEKLFFSEADIPIDWAIPLPGKHNRQNVAAALRLTRQLGVPSEKIQKVVEGFQGVEHRLQKVAVKKGIEFINDSTSTTPVAGCAALDSIENRRILLIAGGSDKKLDLDEFAVSAANKACFIALLQGTATPKLANQIERADGKSKLVGCFDSLKEAVMKLLEVSKPGDIILLSPACASFGMFQNEYDRGNQFINIINSLPDS
jgi:UDP-N-acetylmuramoylalanine--D-glutamate ligase